MANLQFKPFMAYIAPEMILRLKRFARRNKTTMAETIREALDARLASGDPYTRGFNDGVEAAVNAVKNTKGAQMRFPSGKSFSDLAAEEIERHYRRENGNEVNRVKESVSGLQSVLQK